MALEKFKLREDFIFNIRNIIIFSRNAAVRSVDLERMINSSCYL
jgi:hypothetical protein